MAEDAPYPLPPEDQILRVLGAGETGRGTGKISRQDFRRNKTEREGGVYAISTDWVECRCNDKLTNKDRTAAASAARLSGVRPDRDFAVLLNVGDVRSLQLRDSNIDVVHDTPGTTGCHSRITGFKDERDFDLEMRTVLTELAREKGQVVPLPGKTAAAPRK